MNVIYRLVWNRNLRLWVAASEFARTRRDLPCSRPMRRLLAGLVPLALACTAHAQQYWDGSGPFNDGVINGGSGTWVASGDTAWTDATGTSNSSWASDGVAIFQGTAGTVTVSGTVAFGGLQFLTDGYSLIGGVLTTGAASTEMRVASGVTATIGTSLQGAGGLQKTEAGQLVLTGNNTYTGGTVVTAGTLQIGATSNPNYGSTPAGLIRGPVVVENGAALVVTGTNSMGARGNPAENINAVTLNGATITHTGPGDNGWNIAYDLTASTMQTTGTGRFTLGGSGSGTGSSITVRAAATSSVISGRARVREGNPDNALPITVEDGAAPIDLLISGTLDEGGGTPSSHAVTKLGPGLMAISGTGSWTGGTTISDGTFQIGAGGTTGSILGNITNNALLVFDRSDAYSFGGAIGGTGSVAQSGSGTLTLTGAMNYSGGTIFNNGAMLVDSDARLGAAAGGLTFNGGTLRTTAPMSTARAVTMTGDGTLDNAGNAVTLSGVIAGPGTLASTGAGTLTLTGINTFTGGVTISGGTVSIAVSANLGEPPGVLTFNGGRLLTTFGVTTVRPVLVNASGTIDNSGNTDLFVGAMTGPGGMTFTGPGTTILGGNNTYAGGTVVSAGTLQIGDASASGDLAGPVTNNSTLAFARTDELTFDNPISGTGNVVKDTIGTVTLTGANTYSGTTTVNAGRLNISGNQGSATGAVTVANGATLGGSGITGGAITIADGGHLAPGASAGTLTTLGSLTLSPNAILDYEFGEPNAPGGAFNDLVTVGGNLVLDGTLNVTVSPGGTFLGGVYRVIGYGGSLTDNGLAIGSMPPGGPYSVQTAVAGQVNLVNAQGLGPMTFWDGTGPLNNAQVNGGNGTWQASAADASWTDAGGVANVAWQADGFAVFQATPGTVTVDTGAGAVNFSGAQFAVDGYSIGGDALTTSTADTQLRVGDGTPAGSTMTATIAAPVQGTGALNKTDLGKLVLSGTNTYGGGTTISGGMLSVAGDTNLGAASGGLTFNGGTLRTTGALTSARAVTLTGAGTIDTAGTVDTFSGVFSGAGALTLTGGGTVVMTADNTATGLTTIASGTLQLGSGGSTGSIAGDIANDGALSVVRNDDATLAQTISGSGTFTQAGTGSVALTGANTYTGVTSVNAGTLRIDGNQSAATGAVNVASGASLGGSGISGGDVVVADGGHLLGTQGQTLAMDTLALNAASQIDASLADPSTAALFNVNANAGGTGNLTLDGVLNVTATGAFGPGVYRLIAYTGALTDNGLALGSVPAGYTPGSDLVVQTAVAQQVNLVNSLGVSLTFWDGADSARFNNNTIDGGSGTWTASDGNAWTDSAGALNGAWETNGFAIFQGAPGAVTVDNTSGAVTFSGAQFAVNGYTVSGAALTTTTANTVLRVGDGTPAGSAMTATVASVVQGSGGVEKTDLGTLVLTAENTWTGGTLVSAGVLQLGNGGSGGSVTGDIVDNATVTFNRSDTTTFAGVISGSGALVVRQTGSVGNDRLILTAANTYTGGTSVATGTLQIGNDSTTGSIAGNVDVASASTLAFNRTDDLTFADIVSGAGRLLKRDAGTLTLLADSTVANTTIEQGTLQLGNGGTTGGLTALSPIDNQGALVVNRSNAYTLAQNIVGAGSFTQAGSGTSTLTGSNTYTGATAVNAGRLNINGNQSGATGTVSVAAGAALGGSGTLGGAIVVADGGHIAPGESAGTLTTLGDLSLSSGSFLDYEFGQANVPGGPLNDLLNVGGNVTLDGTINVAVSPGGSLLGGVYHVIGYGGTLTDNGLALGTMPPGGPFLVQTSVAGQVNLINTQGLGPLTFWDGNNSALFNNGQVDGGSGTWLASPGNDAWTDSTGVANAPWQANGFAVFQATPGTINADNSAGEVRFSGAQFTVGGYVIAGALTTDTADTILRVGDGTAAGASMTATITADIGGTGGVHKTDLGTLRLAGLNTYTGGTTVTGGALAFDNDHNLGDATGAVTLDAGTLITIAPIVTTRAVALGAGGGTIVGGNYIDTFGGTIDGPGALTVRGGLFVLGADNTYTGGTTVDSATLRLGDGGTAGAIVGNVNLVGGSTLAFDRSDAVQFDGTIAGAGTLLQAGTGTTVLTADNSFSGPSVIAGGQLRLGAGGGTGSVAGPIANDGALAIDRNNALTLAGPITGSGTVTQAGTGTTTLTGANTYAGATTVQAGTLLIDGDQSAATGLVAVASGATLGGTGATGGHVQVSDGGHLLGSQGQVFAIDTLTLNPASQLDVTLTAPGTLGLFDIDGNGGGTGNLTLDGAINITALGTFAPGVYRVMQYSGALTDNGLDLGTVPAGFTPDVDLFVQTSVAQQVNIVNAQGEGVLNFWDGGAAALRDNGAVDGGNGTWTASPVDFAWTGRAGAFNTPWLPDQFAIFQATPGTVNVDDGAGVVAFSGAQFAVDGYVVTGQPLTTNTARTLIRVGDGTIEGATYVATISAVIQGSGALDKIDLGTLVLGADNTYAGGTTISAGTLQLGDGGTSGSVIGGILDNAALVFDRSDVHTFGDDISGTGSVAKAGSGTLVLSGTNTYTGATAVSSGTLQVDGTLASPTVNVATDATLAGTGALAGAVGIADGGRLAPGAASVGTLSLGALTLAPSAQLDYQYGPVDGPNDLVRIAGNLTLDGVLDIADAGGFGEGVYRVFDYGGVLTDNGLALGALPGGFTAADLLVQTAQPGQVNLVVSIGGLALQFWDGAQTSANGVIDGGSGTWDLATSNWTNANGNVNAAWNSGFAVFAGTAGTVTLAQTLAVGGMQFTTDGYRIVSGGAAQLLADGEFDLRTDAGTTTTIDAPIADDGGAAMLIKLGDGTLVLGGANAYSGGTRIEGGVLQVAANGALGVASGAVTLDSGTLRATGSFDATRPTALLDGGGTFDVAAGATLGWNGPISGAGALTKQGAGTLVLGGTNEYGGGTAIDAGIVSVSADANLGAASGAISLDGGALRTTSAFATARAITLGAAGGTFDTQADLAVQSAIAGTGSLTKTGGATLVLNASNAYTGPTLISAGTLRAGMANALSPSSAITIASGSTLDLAGLDQRVASIVNAGLIRTNGQADTRLSVTGSYVGSGGTLQLNTVLGDDASPSDRLVMDGGVATGQTAVRIDNLAGQGALTVANGILAVDDVTGHTTAPGAFALAAPVFAGPYEYALLRGSLDGSNAQAWYLRSSLDCSGANPPAVCPTPPPPPPTPTPPAPPVPHYRAEVSLYAALPGLALRYGRALLGTLHERVGEQDTLRGRDDLDSGDVLNGAWMRVLGLRGDADGDRVGIYGDGGPRYDFDLIAVQGGVDMYRAQREDGTRDHAGIGFAHGRIQSDVTHAVGDQRAGKARIDGDTMSAYWTHYGAGGGYLDALVQGTWFDADATSDRGIELRTDEGGFGWGASLEGGLPFRRGEWSIEPQAQLLYQSFDELTGHDPGARVRWDNTDSLAARIGLRVARTHALVADRDGSARTATGWLRLNYWHEFEAEPRTSFSSAAGEVPFRNDLTGGWGQINVGVSAQLGRNTSLYANLDYERSSNGRYDAWDGSVGMRWNW